MGDVVEPPSPSGILSLPIVGIVRNYSNMQGSVFIDRSVCSGKPSNRIGSVDTLTMPY